jgi:hypothetical protein
MLDSQNEEWDKKVEALVALGRAGVPVLRVLMLLRSCDAAGHGFHHEKSGGPGVERGRRRGNG